MSGTNGVMPIFCADFIGMAHYRVDCFQRGVQGYNFQPQLVADTNFGINICFNVLIISSRTAQTLLD
jgi:hypothetical protein